MTSSRKALAAIAFAIGLLGLVPWGEKPLIAREQELRVVLTARDMARGGNWLVPHYLGEPRLNKPPLMYWITAGVFKLAETTQSPALARLPGAFFGAILLAALAALGHRLVGRTAAFYGAVVAGTTYLFLCFGRLCETDIPLACCEAISVLAIYKGLSARNGARWWTTSAVAAGLGFLIKGPAAILLPLATLTSFLAITPAARATFRPGRLLGWILIVVLLGAPWYLLIYSSQAAQAASGDIGYELGALLKHSSHAGPPFFYLYILPLALAPWGILLPFSLVTLWPFARRHAAIRFLMAWLLSSLILMSLIKSKQIHYATLLLAPSALLIGIHLRLLLDRPRARPATVLNRAATAVNILLGLTGFALMLLPFRLAYLSLPACASTGVLVIGLSLYGGGALHPERLLRNLSAACLSTLLLSGLYAWQLHEITEPSRIVKAFATGARNRLSPTSTVYLAGRRLNAMQYYLDRPIIRVKDYETGWQAARTNDAIILAADRKNPMLPPVPGPLPVLILQQDRVAMLLYVKNPESVRPRVTAP
jgi:4-amino-4-deoxy-L-arabinose transferase-like glycosyltransferase